MSYILEALKKADRERAAGNVPDLETVHRHEPPARKPYRWLWILAALFIFNGVLVTLLATRHDAGIGEGAIGHRAAPDDRGSSLPDTARLQAPAEDTPLVRKPPPKVVRTTPQMQERHQVVAARPASPLMQPPTEQDQTAAPPVTVAQPAPTPAVIPPTAPLAAPAAAPMPDTIPEWDDLPLDFRSGFSMPRMDVHVYDPDPQRRFVLVDLQKFREGDQLPNGAMIEIILPDGIQLSYQGTRFHYGK
jgi:general secretion pathway protein B